MSESIKTKLLIICPYRLNKSPGQRFRFEQYLNYLKKNNYDIEISYLLSADDEKVFYSKNKIFLKFFLLLKMLFFRLKDVKKSKYYDIVFIYREAFPLGSYFIEKLISKNNKNIIFDFDDSIHLEKVSDGNKRFKFLKNPNKIKEIIALSSLTIVGNKFLKNFAYQHSENVKIFPTTIDTELYNPSNYKVERKFKEICIGWSGSFSTVEHFETVIPILKKIKKKYKDKIIFKLIGDENYINKSLNLKGIRWCKENEIEDLLNIDIGIMPLKNNNWEKGKCGLKGLQYMALNIPTIMSNVGVNSEIIDDGINGFLASSDDEWFHKLSILIEDKILREKIGNHGRVTVKEKYSLNANKENYLSFFNEIVSN